MRFIKNSEHYFRPGNPKKYPKVDRKHPLQATLNRASLDRQFAEKAEAIQRLRQQYEAQPPSQLSSVKPSKRRYVESWGGEVKRFRK